VQAVGIGDWFRRGETARFDGTRGRPPSGNGASSFHLSWDVGGGPWRAAEAVLEVLEAPGVPKLVFWALQVSFAGRGSAGGGAHLGLQWFPAHPGGTAVNWGGYGGDGRELEGSASALPSAPGNPNTRDFAWSPGRRYRLRIEPAPSVGQAAAPGRLRAWRGTVTDMETAATTVVRDLYASGDHLDGPMVWSEVFADCDEPGGRVRWSDLRLFGEGGRSMEVTTVRVNYQRVAEGGCVTTSSTAEGPGQFVQATGTNRTTARGARIP
jgi:hypothetical protein